MSPADLPVEQPTKFALVISMKTAQAGYLGNTWRDDQPWTLEVRPAGGNEFRTGVTVY